MTATLLAPIFTKMKFAPPGIRLKVDGYDAKITGDVTIKIFVDGTQIAKSTSSLVIGKALKIKLTTSKVGWYDSGILCIQYKDVEVETVTIDI